MFGLEENLEKIFSGNPKSREGRAWVEGNVQGEKLTSLFSLLSPTVGFVEFFVNIINNRCPKLNLIDGLDFFRALSVDALWWKMLSLQTYLRHFRFFFFLFFYFFIYYFYY